MAAIHSPTRGAMLDVRRQIVESCPSAILEGMEAFDIPLHGISADRLRSLPQNWGLAVVDGSCRRMPGDTTGDLFVGGVILDQCGRELHRFSRPAGRGCSMAAEYRAIRVALQLAARLGLAGLEIHSDSQQAVRAITRHKPPKRPVLARLHQSALDLLNRLPSNGSVRFVGRDHVQAGHRLAAFAARTGCGL